MEIEIFNNITFMHNCGKNETILICPIQKIASTNNSLILLESDVGLSLFMFICKVS